MEDVLNNIIEYILNPILLVVFSLGILMFMWGLVEFIADPANETKRKTGIQHMIWGTVGVFIMVSVHGIISFIENTFGL